MTKNVMSASLLNDSNPGNASFKFMRSSRMHVRGLGAKLTDLAYTATDTRSGFSRLRKAT